MSESIASSLGSNLNRVTSNINMPMLGMGGPSDLKKMLLGDDYFSDVNPRSMRRLMNIIHITGLFLKFNTHSHDHTIKISIIATAILFFLLRTTSKVIQH